MNDRGRREGRENKKKEDKDKNDKDRLKKRLKNNDKSKWKK